MTTATLTRSATRTAGGGYGFRSVARMEWLKLRSVRSTPWILLVFAAGMIGLSVLVLSHTHWAAMSAADRATFDPVNEGFTGLALGQLVLGVLGVLAITTEFSSGMIRATFAAVPRRPMVLAAKAAVVGAVTLVAGEVLAFGAFAAGELALRSPAPHATLGQPGVLRAVLLAGAYPCLIALIALGLGAIIRNTAAAISAVPGAARHPRPARRPARGPAGRGVPLPDRAHRAGPWRHHQEHRRRDLGGPRRRTPPSASPASCARSCWPGRTPA